jgi:hypothetical protein
MKTGAGAERNSFRFRITAESMFMKSTTTKNPSTLYEESRDGSFSVRANDRVCVEGQELPAPGLQSCLIFAQQAHRLLSGQLCLLLYQQAHRRSRSAMPLLSYRFTVCNHIRYASSVSTGSQMLPGWSCLLI